MILRCCFDIEHYKFQVKKKPSEIINSWMTTYFSSSKTHQGCIVPQYSPNTSPKYS
jgi:hypothetical protein